ncbi:hypothetical protein [Rhizobium leguminosarum]|uniref:hypothetical protein n=1 Tax=Rhizobium leguminosarum TaxID=384 RepID=UPI0013EF1C69|nr:hypothetical protein [Rhizobium leguminosarum]
MTDKKLSLEELMELAHKQLDAVLAGEARFDGETAMAVEWFVQRWNEFDKEISKEKQCP